MSVDQLHADIERLTRTVAQLSELADLKAEVGRLTQTVTELTAELDTYRRAAQAWAAAELTEAEIQRYGQEEPGVPLKAFLGELEQRVRGQ